MIKDDRYIIPRWLSPFSQKQNLPKFIEKPLIERSLNDWKNLRTIGSAEDLISSAFLANELKNRDIKNAAQYVLEKSSLAGSRGLADYILSPSKPVPVKKLNIRQCRKMVNIIPYNGILRIEYARQLLIVGAFEKAEKQIQIAVGQSNNHPWIIRAALRFCCHIKKPDKGLWYLRKAYSASNDISLVAPEIAVSSMLNKNSRLAKLGSKLPFADSTEEEHAGEILAGMVSKEIENGNSRKAKKLINNYKQGLNENSLSQLLWLVDEYDIQIQLNNIDNLPNPYEVNARIATIEGDDQKAFQACKEWYNFQPFSSAPAIHGSYISSMILGNHSASIELLEKSMHSSNSKITIWNNLAFDYLHTDQTDKAFAAIRKAKTLKPDNDSDKYVLKATEGLLEIKLGNTSKGDHLYKEAITYFSKQKELELEIVCRCMWLSTLNNRLADTLEREIKLVDGLLTKTNDIHTHKIAAKAVNKLQITKNKITIENFKKKIVREESSQLTINFEETEDFTR